MDNHSFADADFGIITVKVNEKARSVIFRLAHDELKVTVPAHCSSKEFRAILEKHRSALLLKLQKAKPIVQFDETTELKTNRFSVKIFKTERVDFFLCREGGGFFGAGAKKTAVDRK